MMKAARLHKVGKALSIDSVEIPRIGAADVLVDVQGAGICHSDIHYRNGVSPVSELPITLGHEIAGVIAETGGAVEGVEKGDRVLVHYVISCGSCNYCRTGREHYCAKYQMIGKTVDGGLAEYVKVPARNVLKLPQTIPFEQAAILGCAVSTAYHSLKRGNVGDNDTVVVYGVGGLGSHAIQLASKIFKAKRVIAVDISEGKLEIAARMGASEVVNANSVDPVERIEEITEGRLADVVLDYVGQRKTIENAIRFIGMGGRVVLVGVSPDEIQLSPYRTIIGKEMALIGSDDHLKSELSKLIELIESRKLDLSTSITHKVRLEDVNDGMQIVEGNIGNPIRVVVVK
ncbi:MAG: alcohol dehydrogenase catalytic domain-containing protein [Candidatus Bathyarchaeia archaeon]|jgi:propanol-preferring alcohol dehydrogenase